MSEVHVYLIEGAQVLEANNVNSDLVNTRTFI